MTLPLRPLGESGASITEYVLILAPLVAFVALAILTIAMSGSN